MAGQYDETAWITKSQARARTVHSRYGSWEKAAKAVGVSHNTLRSYARGDTTPKPETLTKMNRMVGQYRRSDTAMTTITQTAVRQERIAQRRGIREASKAGTITERKASQDLAATPLLTQQDLDLVEDRLMRARETDDGDDWELFRNAYAEVSG